MINSIAASSAEPKMYSATYVENYLDSVENLPNDVQRYLTRIREIDLQYRVHLRDVDYYYDQWSNCSTNELESTNATSKRARAMARIQQSLIAAQELGDEKLQVVTQLQEMIDLKTRQLDADYKNLEYADKDDPALASPSPKETRPSSPASYVPSTSSANQKNSESRIDDNIPSNSGVSLGSGNNERVSVVTGSNSGTNSGSSNNHNNGDRSWKRSRRARNETSSRSGNNGNSYSNISKTSQIDLASDSNNSNSNQSKSNANTSSQQSNTGGNIASNSGSNRKQSGNSGGGGSGAGKKRKRKSGRAQNVSNNASSNANTFATSSSQNNARTQVEEPLEETIDPEEPTYCLCDQISFGEMILCDNDLCPIEWFHFSCVSLTTKPKGKWFCPNCRGDRPSVMKPKQQFLKELERYNREKEEKT